jgi:all-trans-8'-apo-beta-carotenal 15,15'-oxygenase
MGEPPWMPLVSDGVEIDETLEIEGRVPASLRGMLFRVGPGLFGRKRLALDGDGFVQRFAIADGQVRYRSRFVRTAKFVAEQAAGRALMPTWSTPAPGWFANMGTARIRSQASVTLSAAGPFLLARDEVGAAWRLDRDTLATMGEDVSVAGNGRMVPKAHVKTDPVTGETVMLGCTYGRRMAIHVITQDPVGVTRRHLTQSCPRQVYLHDFFLTRRYVVVLLHPALLHPLRFVLGLDAFTDCLSWRPDLGNCWLVAARDGDTPPRWFEGPPGWMWHGLGAVEQGDAIVADWIGYGAPDHFLGPDAALRAMMRGQAGRADCPGQVRRTILDLASLRLTEDVAIAGNFEFPVRRDTQAAYVTVAPQGTILADGVARVEPGTGRIDAYRGGSGLYFGEPLPTQDGWVLVPGLDARRGRSFLGIFAADAIADGPIAQAWLSRTMPGSFHGDWLPA